MMNARGGDDLADDDVKAVESSTPTSGTTTSANRSRRWSSRDVQDDAPRRDELHPASERQIGGLVLFQRQAREHHRDGRPEGEANDPRAARTRSASGTRRAAPLRALRGGSTSRASSYRARWERRRRRAAEWSGWRPRGMRRDHDAPRTARQVVQRHEPRSSRARCRRSRRTRPGTTGRTAAGLTKPSPTLATAPAEPAMSPARPSRSRSATGGS